MKSLCVIWPGQVQVRLKPWVAAHVLVVGFARQLYHSHMLHVVLGNMSQTAWLYAGVLRPEAEDLLAKAGSRERPICRTPAF
jgi:hypothetical protein